MTKKKPTKKEREQVEEVLGDTLRGILSKPAKKLKSPTKMPSRAELRRKWRLIDGKMVEVIGGDDD